MGEQPVKVTKGMVVDWFEFEDLVVNLVRDHKGNDEIVEMHLAFNVNPKVGFIVYLDRHCAYELGESLIEIGDKPDRPTIPAAEVSAIDYGGIERNPDNEHWNE